MASAGFGSCAQRVLTAITRPPLVGPRSTSKGPGDEVSLNLSAIAGKGPDHAEQQFTV
jgi:hypothetical protein